jgi:hypothetical protein
MEDVCKSWLPTQISKVAFSTSLLILLSLFCLWKKQQSCKSEAEVKAKSPSTFVALWSHFWFNFHQHEHPYFHYTSSVPAIGVFMVVKLEQKCDTTEKSKLGKTGTKVQFCSSFVKGLQRSNWQKTGTKLDFTQFCKVQPLLGDCHQICCITTKTKLALVSHFCFQFCSSFLYHDMGNIL